MIYFSLNNLHTLSLYIVYNLIICIICDFILCLGVLVNPTQVH